MGELSFDESDWAFIRNLSARFPDKDIQQNFQQFFEMPARIRPQHAAFRLNLVPRQGFVRIGIPESEGQQLADHVRTLQEMVALSPPGIDRERLYDILTVHDMAEVITGDFTPVDAITRDEKYRLEKLAMAVIYEDEPGKIELWEEYAANRTEDAHWAKDLDKLEFVLEIAQQEKKHPRLRQVFNEFRDNAQAGLQTGRGREIFALARETAAGDLSKSAHIRQIAGRCALLLVVGFFALALSSESYATSPCVPAGEAPYAFTGHFEKRLQTVPVLQCGRKANSMITNAFGQCLDKYYFADRSPGNRQRYMFAVAKVEKVPDEHGRHERNITVDVAADQVTREETTIYAFTRNDLGDFYVAGPGKLCPGMDALPPDR